MTLLNGMDNPLVAPPAIHAMAAALRDRDLYTDEHQQRVSELAGAIGRELGLSETEVRGVVLAAKLHDMGKTYIPTVILNKPGRLSDFEYGIMKNHPRLGYEMLRGLEFPWPIAEIVHQHHERLDGSGYPRGLRGSEILLPARIIGVADVVEAMTSDRPYRPAISMENTLEYILEGRRTLYDDRVVHACRWLCAIKGFSFSERGLDPARARKDA